MEDKIITATISSETDQNGIREEEILVQEEPKFIPPPFRLIVGMEYVLAGRLRMNVLQEQAGSFLGIIDKGVNVRGYVQWYTPDGRAERDFEKYPEQDPFDVVSIYHEPHVIYMLRDNMTLEYQSNTCFLSRDAAIKAALERKLAIVTFKEITE